ncbi:MAG: tol-pal system-associated acyl-CoA thioesterase [Terricaulis sp.]
MNADQPSAGRFEGRCHILPVRIYYEDTDFTGFVYHANYLRYFERARSDYLRLAGINHSALLEGESPSAFAVSKITLDFLKPARIDDALTVHTAYDSMKGARIAISQSLRRGDDVLVRAGVEACCIGLTGRPKKPPALLLERLKPFLEPSASSF